MHLLTYLKTKTNRLAVQLHFINYVPAAILKMV